MTVTIDATGRYHASFVVDVPDQPFPAVDREVGIDLGLTLMLQPALGDGRVTALKCLCCKGKS